MGSLVLTAALFERFLSVPSSSGGLRGSVEVALIDFPEVGMQECFGSEPVLLELDS